MSEIITQDGGRRNCSGHAAAVGQFHSNYIPRLEACLREFYCKVRFGYRNEIRFAEYCSVSLEERDIDWMGACGSGLWDWDRISKFVAANRL